MAYDVNYKLVLRFVVMSGKHGEAWQQRRATYPDDGFLHVRVRHLAVYCIKVLERQRERWLEYKLDLCHLKENELVCVCVCAIQYIHTIQICT